MRSHLWAATLSALLAGTALAQTPVPPVGTATPRTAMTDAQIKAHLEQQGYSNVQVGKHESGGHVDVMATKGGKNQKLDVDPVTGQAKPDTD